MSPHPENLSLDAYSLKKFAIQERNKGAAFIFTIFLQITENIQLPVTQSVITPGVNFLYIEVVDRHCAQIFD
jgi:hypothetical protein